jgi:hypothetical protein
VTDAQLAEFFEHQVQSRPITVDVSRSTERRLRRYLASIDRYEQDEPIDASDSSLAIAIISTCDAGLREAESEDRVWTGIDGADHPLPRAVRAPVMMRAKFCWRAARNMWRST